MGARVRVAAVEWPTLGLLVGTYGLWALGTTWAAELWLPLGMFCVMLAAVLHSSLCHEALHGHPTRLKWLNETLVFVQLSLVIPYGRFRDLHLIHHRDENLTDPYDDPESNYRDPKVWAVMPRWGQALLRFNNRLLGRIVIGPAVGQFFFMREDWRAIRAGDTAALRAWLVHIPAVALVIWWVLAVGDMPLWAFFLASFLKSRWAFQLELALALSLDYWLGNIWILRQKPRETFFNLQYCKHLQLLNNKHCFLFTLRLNKNLA